MAYKNREDALRYAKKYNDSHKEERREYYNENKEEILKWHKEHYEKNKERILSKRKERYAKNDEVRENIIESNKKYREKNVKKIREYDRNKNCVYDHGIDLAQKDELFKAQGRKCAICEENILIRKHIHIDHDHNTGEIRGILCHNCNTKLGWYEKYKDKAEKYLNQPKLRLVKKGNVS